MGKQARCVHVGLCGIPYPVTARVLRFPSRIQEKLRALWHRLSPTVTARRGNRETRNRQFDKRKSTAGHQWDKSSFLFATEATQNQGARTTKHPDGKESMDMSSDVSPRDSRRKKAEREGRQGRTRSINR